MFDKASSLLHQIKYNQIYLGVFHSCWVVEKTLQYLLLHVIKPINVKLICSLQCDELNLEHNE